MGNNNHKVKVAILGSGNIGSDLMFKILREPGHMSLAMLSGVDPESEGLARARALGVTASHDGIQPILDDPDIRIVFDATSARAHVRHHVLRPQAQLAAQEVEQLLREGRPMAGVIVHPIREAAGGVVGRVATQAGAAYRCPIPRAAGAPALEAYPVDTAVPGHTGNLFPGTASAFTRHGFEVVARRKPDRPVMRRILRPAP